MANYGKPKDYILAELAYTKYWDDAPQVAFRDLSHRLQMKWCDIVRAVQGFGKKESIKEKTHTQQETIVHFGAEDRWKEFRQKEDETDGEWLERLPQNDKGQVAKASFPKDLQYAIIKAYQRDYYKRNPDRRKLKKQNAE
jgi:hypothetical protein